MNKEITIIIPCRESENAHLTLKSLARQTFRDFDIIVVHDEGKGANWARNKGFEVCNTEFVLFCDNDIEWVENGIGTLYIKLTGSGESYSYGSYLHDYKVHCDKPFDDKLLKKMSIVSTMSLIRSADFPGFDENIQRLQDWDLFLTMLEQEKRGAYCNEVLFTTPKRNGITHGDVMNWEEADRIVKEKHGLLSKAY